MTKGERIREKRKEAGYTLDYVAKQIGVSRQTMSRYETGVLQNIPSDTIEDIAKALGITPSYIMGWEDEEGAVDIGLAALDIKHGTNMSDEEALYKAEQTISRYQAEKPAPISGDGLSDTAREIMNIVNRLSDDRQLAALAQIKALEQLRG